MTEHKALEHKALEHKALLGTFKSATGLKGVTIEGWANRAVIDRANDLIPKSAWQLDNFKKNAIILWNHDKNKPIGRALAVEARDEGLYVKARISASSDPEISRIRDLIQEGVLNAFSVGFDATEEAKSVDGYNEIRGAELFEISVVSLPMNQDSLFTTTKAHTLDAVTTKARELAPQLFTEKDSGSPAGEAEGADGVAKAAAGEDEEAAVAAAGDAPVARQEISGKGLELEWQSLNLPKKTFADVEAVAAYFDQIGLDEMGLLTDDGDYWTVTLEPEDRFVALSALVLPGGVICHVGVCNPVQKAAEDAAEGEAESEGEDAPEAKSATLEADLKEMPTAPLAEAPQVDLPEELLQARQTNILLSQIVAEFQGLRAAVLELAHAQPPKAAPVPAPTATAPKSGEDLTPVEHDVFAEYRQLMADISRRIDRLDA